MYTDAEIAQIVMEAEKKGYEHSKPSKETLQIISLLQEDIRLLREHMTQIAQENDVMHKNQQRIMEQLEPVYEVYKGGVIAKHLLTAIVTTILTVGAVIAAFKGLK